MTWLPSKDCIRVEGFGGSGCLGIRDYGLGCWVLGYGLIRLRLRSTMGLPGFWNSQFALDVLSGCCKYFKWKEVHRCCIVGQARAFVNEVYSHASILLACWSLGAFSHPQPPSPQSVVCIDNSIQHGCISNLQLRDFVQCPVSPVV